jgi:hypothetical protein
MALSVSIWLQPFLHKLRRLTARRFARRRWQARATGGRWWRRLRASAGRPNMGMAAAWRGVTATSASAGAMERWAGDGGVR